MRILYALLLAVSLITGTLAMTNTSTTPEFYRPPNETAEQTVATEPEPTPEATLQTTAPEVGPEETASVETTEIAEVPLSEGVVITMDDMLSEMETTDQLNETSEPTEPETSVTTEPQPHVHDMRIKSETPASCTESGLIIRQCECGFTYEEVGEEPKGHKWGSWKTLKEPTAEEEGTRVKECSRCHKEKTDKIDKLIIYENYFGTLSIPNVGIKVCCYKPVNNNGQEIVDRENSAMIYHSIKDCWILADHNNQDHFNNIKKCHIGTTGQIVCQDGSVMNLTCIDVVKGHNTGKILTDENGNDMRDLYPNTVLAYTCNDKWQNVTIVVFTVN